MFIEIVSPEKTIYTGDVSSVFLPGTEGFFQVLDNHAPIVSTLKKGTIELKGEFNSCLLYTSPSPRDGLLSRMPSSA